MRRWHQERARTKTQWKKHRASHVQGNVGSSQGYGEYQNRPGFDPNVVSCACDNQKGRFRKRKAFDCGKSHCYICHSDKFPQRELTRQEMRAEMKMKDD